jgi:hypothetical protein
VVLTAAMVVYNSWRTYQGRVKSLPATLLAAFPPLTPKLHGPARRPQDECHSLLKLGRPDLGLGWVDLCPLSAPTSEIGDFAVALFSFCAQHAFFN